MSGRRGAAAAAWVRAGLRLLRRGYGPVETLSVAAVAVAVAVAAGPLPSPPGAAAAVATDAVLAVLVAALLLAVVATERRTALVAVLVAVLDVGAAILAFGPAAVTLAAPVAGTAVFLAPRRVAAAVAVAVLGLTVVEVVLAPVAEVARTLLRVAIVMGQVGAAGTMVRQARTGSHLRRRCRGVVEASRHLRASHDVHEALAQNLATVSFRSELAARLTGRDPGRAVREMNDVGALARSSMADLVPLVAERHERVLEDELDAAADLLRSAGIRTVAGPVPDGLDPAVRALLGRVVEEGAGIVLAGPRASVCSITFHSADGRVAVTVRHDGQDDEDDDEDGHDLDGLAESLAAAGGRLDHERDGGRGAHLTATLPLGGRDDAERQDRARGR